jgi:hypothetical protein
LLKKPMRSFFVELCPKFAAEGAVGERMC